MCRRAAAEMHLSFWFVGVSDLFTDMESKYPRRETAALHAGKFYTNNTAAQEVELLLNTFCF